MNLNISKIRELQRSEVEQAEQYRAFFMSTAFILHRTIVMPEFDWANGQGLADRQAVLNNFQEQYLGNFDVIKYLSRHRCRPVNVFDYAVDVVGPHALD